MRKTPDIPQNVFFDEGGPAEAEAPPEAPVTARRQAVKTSSSQAVKTAKRQAVKTASSQAVKQSSSQKVQVTVYLSEAADKELERLRFELLSKHNLRASRSGIVEAAILGVGERLGEIAAAALGEGAG